MFIPTVGITYSFKFLPEYISLNGIYHVAKVMTIQEALMSGIDLVIDFYNKVGLDSNTYKNDLAMLEGTRIIKLLNPTTLSESSTIHAPMYYLSEQPDHNVKQYYKLVVGLNLGIHENPEQLSFIISNLAQMFSSSFGITNTPELFEIDNVWMTLDEYKDLEDERKNLASDEIINYFSENVRLEKENSDLRSRLAAYEEIIKTHAVPNQGG